MGDLSDSCGSEPEFLRLRDLCELAPYNSCILIRRDLSIREYSVEGTAFS